MSNSGNPESLEARLTRLEDLINLNLNMSTGTHLPPPTLGAETEASYTADNTAVAQIARAWALGHIEPRFPLPQDGSNLPLPPREEVSRVVAHYFQTASDLVPIFQWPAFSQLLDAWYTNPSSRDPATWAAIHTVMALGLRSADAKEGTPTIGTIQRASAHLSNAQSVLAEIAIRDEDLLGIRTLLGIVMLCRISSNQKRASVLIALASRLAQRMMLHSSRSVYCFPPEESLQRSRLFWVAYILDKQISLGAKVSSIQSDEDIDLPLPPLLSPDGVGVIWTHDGNHEMNYFRFRVELANIQGKIYELLYSNRSSTIESLERSQRIAQIQTKLNNWYESIPHAFRIEHVASMVTPFVLVEVTKMFHRYFMAEVMTNGFYSPDADWLKLISSKSWITMNDISIAQDTFGAARYIPTQNPPSPLGWDKLVQTARGCLILFHNTTQVECLVWQCSCGFSSALLVLLANLFLHPFHSTVVPDQQLCSKSIDLLDMILQAVDDKALESVRRIAKELSKIANNAVESFNSGQDQTAHEMFQDFSAGWDTFLLENFCHSTFHHDPDGFDDRF